MNANKALWEKGDFTRIAASMRESGEALVESLGSIAGLVLGVDIASNLVEAGNRRAQAEGLSNCRFHEGDASNLQRDTYRFDFSASPAELVSEFRSYYGPTMNAFEAAEANRRTAELEQELAALFTAQNDSPTADTTSIPATFLRVTVAVRRANGHCPTAGAGQGGVTR